MSLGITDIKISELDDNDRLLYEAGMIDENKIVTGAGWEMLKVIVQRKHKRELIEMVQKINSSKETE